MLRKNSLSKQQFTVSLKASDVRLPNTAHGLRGDEKFCHFSKKISRLETSVGYVAAGM
jgi:hypothetical protein